MLPAEAYQCHTVPARKPDFLSPGLETLRKIVLHLGVGGPRPPGLPTLGATPLVTWPIPACLQVESAPRPFSTSLQARGWMTPRTLGGRVAGAWLRSWLLPALPSLEGADSTHFTAGKAGELCITWGSGSTKTQPSCPKTFNFLTLAGLGQPGSGPGCRRSGGAGLGFVYPEEPTGAETGR